MGLTSECREQREKKQTKTERMVEIIQSVTKRRQEQNKKQTNKQTKKKTKRKHTENKMNRVPETLFKGSNSDIGKTDEKEVRLKKLHTI